MTAKDADGVTQTGSDSKVQGVGGETKVIAGKDGRCLPTKSGWENLAHRHFGSYSESVQNSGGNLVGGPFSRADVSLLTARSVVNVSLCCRRRRHLVVVVVVVVGRRR